MTQIRKALQASYAQFYLLLIPQFVVTVIIANLLTPYEIGVFSVAMSLLAIGNSVRDFGVSNYLVQEKELTDSRVRTARGVAFLVAWGIALAFVLAAKPVAAFYREPGVAGVMYVLSLNFLLIPFGSITMAYMRRNMMYGELARVHVISGTVQMGASLALVYLGYSYYSMAWGGVLGNLVRVSMLWFIAPPDLPGGMAWKERRRVASFGAYSGAAALLQEAGRGLPDMALGRLMGMSAVGFFSRATGLIDLFNRLIVQAVAFVALSHFSAKLRAGEDVSAEFLKAVTYLTGLGWPFFVFLAFTAQPVVLLLYGPQWGESVPLVAILCMAEVLLTPFYLVEHVLIAHGRADWEMGRNLLVAAAKLLPLVLLPPFGLQTVALGLVGSSLFLAVAFYWMLVRNMRLDLSSFLRAMAPSLAVSALVGLALALMYWLEHRLDLGMISTLALNTLALFAAALLAGAWVRHPLLDEIRHYLGRLRGVDQR